MMGMTCPTTWPLAADLRRMQLTYGKPSDARIDEYAEEVAILLHGGYLKLDF